MIIAEATGEWLLGVLLGGGEIKERKKHVTASRSAFQWSGGYHAQRWSREEMVIVVFQGRKERRKRRKGYDS